MSDLVLERSARFSDCGAYRYTLTRSWGGEGTFYPMVFVMLNPSTADAEIDDPTIRRCMGFAQRERKTAIIVCNLFAFRATSPKAMKASRDPVGPDNDAWLQKTFVNAALRAAPIVAAWGAHGSFKERDRSVWRLARGQAADLLCLGRTKDGAPKHPLYVAGNTKLEPWSP